MSDVVRGACYCGAVTVEVAAALRPPVNCHCGQCRRLSGAAFTTWITARQESVVLSGGHRLTRFAPTPRLLRHFCAVCGSHVFTTDARLPGTWGFPAGLFPGDQVSTPASDWFVSDKAPWYALAGGTKCYGGPDGTEPMSGSASRD